MASTKFPNFFTVEVAALICNRWMRKDGSHPGSLPKSLIWHLVWALPTSSQERRQNEASLSLAELNVGSLLPPSRLWHNPPAKGLISSLLSSLPKQMKSLGSKVTLPSTGLPSPCTLTVCLYELKTSDVISFKVSDSFASFPYSYPCSPSLSFHETWNF